MRLDTHQHFWDLANSFTDWPTSDLSTIHRNFGPDDLRAHLSQCAVGGTILVQAAPSIAETEYCLAVARGCDFVKGVVGWIDFEASDAMAQLERLAGDPLLVGLRPMVQSIAEPGWLLQDSLAPLFTAMTTHKLPLDGLVLAHQIGDLDRLAQRHRDLAIVLDHGGKPPIASDAFGDWSQAISSLARNPNTHCKLSGLWTEAGGDISPETIRPWVSHLLDCFGPQRLMWGSDWPVIELAGDFGDWFAQCEALLDDLSGDEQAAIFGRNGRRFYGID